VILYSLIEACARAGVNPRAYLTDILLRVGTHPQSRVAELTPPPWASYWPQLSRTSTGKDNR
jgi:hypothetical protein